MSCLHNSSRSFQWIKWNLPVIVPMTWRGSHHTEVTLDRFLPELWRFVSFSHFINRGSCLRNSSYSFQGILMKLSRYCCHDLKMIICYWGIAQQIQSCGPLTLFFYSKSCLCNSSCSFQWILMIASSYCSHDLKRIILNRGYTWLLFTRVMALCHL